MQYVRIVAKGVGLVQFFIRKRNIVKSMSISDTFPEKKFALFINISIVIKNS